MLPRLVLGSGSPRRKELLERLQIPFQTQAAEVSEDLDGMMRPHDIVKTLAMRKASAVASYYQNALIIGADTIVVCDGQVLGKPQNQGHASEMLHDLQGRDHEVYSGLVLLEKKEGRLVGQAIHSAMTKVWLAPLSTQTISWYIGTKEPLDKAGAYGIQGIGACLVERIEGCYFNVVGMSLSTLKKAMNELGYSLPSLVPSFGRSMNPSPE